MSDDGVGAAVGTFVAVGLLYWVAVGAAMVMAAVVATVAVVAVGAIIYMIMGGVAFATAVSTGRWGVVRDAILAPGIGLTLALAFPEANRDIVYALLDAPNALTPAASGKEGGLVALLTVVFMFGLLLFLFVFYVSGLGFGFFVASESVGLRTFGYLACAAWGVAYSGTAMLIMQGTFS